MNNKPIKSEHVKDVYADIWLNSASINDRRIKIPAVTFRRIYKNKQNQYKSTHTFDRKHLSLLKEVIEKVEEYFETGG